MNYQFITDAGHGWLQVPVTELMRTFISSNTVIGEDE